MLDAASLQAGGMVTMVSSLDEDHPGENAIDGNDRTYWISTGLYPQEILVQLCHPSWVASLCIASTQVKQLRIEGCNEDQPINFHPLADGELAEASGRLQVEELACPQQDRPIRFIRMMILSGWQDFCTVHRLQVKATKPDPADMPQDGLLLEPTTHPRPLSPLGGSGAASWALGDSSLEQRRRSSKHYRKSLSLSVEIPPHSYKHPDEVNAPRVVHPTTWDGSTPAGSGHGMAGHGGLLHMSDDVSLNDDDPLSPRLSSRLGPRQRSKNT